ncbi:MAG: response regulator, partial [Bacteroidota bacterium]
ISGYLASYSIQCKHCSSCSQAESLVNDDNYAAIILNPFEDAFNLISSIKAGMNNSSVPIVIIKILDEQKYGWEPKIYDFIVKELLKDELSTVIQKVEEEADKKVSRALLVADYNTENTESNTLLKLNSERNFVKVVSSDEMSSLRNPEKPDVILIDVDSLKANSFEVCYSISSNRELKGCPVVFVLPAKLDKTISAALVESYERIAARVKMHPLDILKVIRDRLNLAEFSEMNKVMLIEEPAEKEIVLEKRKKKKSKPTILVVDDDDDALFTVGEYIRELGFDTVFAHNGMECLLMLNHIVPDLILLDIMMPQMDGFETIKRIRADNRFMKLPVIAFTAYAMLENQYVIEKNGFDDLVTKPINYQSLSAKISKYLAKEI